MRPIELTPLFASLQSLTGIGPRLILLMRKCVNLPAGMLGEVVDQVHPQLATEGLGRGIDAHRRGDGDGETLRHGCIVPSTPVGIGIYLSRD